ncbi:MAG: alpha/beta hydrolase, partial [Candidatus Riflebacteria bacterium]|nr:alpha/beta hydrolase [Candidatus Riflebacteria bacterium]
LADKPALVCFGRKDFVFGRHFFDEWKMKLPQAEFHSFHAGHYALEDAGDKIFRLVRALFAANP